jgi:hypothetical protein
MQRALLTSALLIVIAGLGVRPPSAGADGVTWLRDLEAARRSAETSGKPLFLVFRCEP